MKVTQVIKRVEKPAPVDPEFTAVQYIEGKELPKGVFLKEVNDGTDEEPNIVTKAFIATKDTDGDGNVDGAFSSVGNGCYILTAEDGSVSIVHPTVFEAQFKKEGK